MHRKSKITILTGAGISAESGLGTFRDRNGLWTQVNIEDVATPEAFARDPAKVHAFYNMRRANAADASPNAAHHALTKLQNDWPGDVVLITQNVDGLHERAGSEVLHMHGQLDRALCAACGHRWDAPRVMDPQDPCPDCARPATRPDIVWFGEMPYHMEEIAEHLRDCDLFAAIGTSGAVYPAAGFCAEAAMAGAETVELNLAESDVSASFGQRIEGPASSAVPDWVAGLLAGR
ncbi:NAD-dependent deacylase [Thalassococcus sp. BH17M4-6]|uniref:NAD-dependent deacylase n=1 Tax=Thalassococcus sp. BH17M4-6 TaxID=3413148 RepID=UPI003BBFE89F